ncbi:MAG: hypothetical protein JKY67_17765 [Pseudomonadales bacterium]|nr:hypothetical protein [Pseudomonadales bacterium]
MKCVTNPFSSIDFLTLKFSKPDAGTNVFCAEVGRDNSSEQAREQRSENHVVSTVAEWVERSVSTLLFIHLSEAIKAGTITLQYSYKYAAFMTI